MRAPPGHAVRHDDVEAGVIDDVEAVDAHSFSDGKSDEKEEDAGSGVLSWGVFIFTWWVRPLKRLIPAKRRHSGADFVAAATP